jgi:hypothetical protein
MRAPLLAATALFLLAQPTAAAPGGVRHSGTTSLLRIDFELLKQAEQQSAQDKAAADAKKAADDKAAEDAAKKAQAEKEAADKAAADKAAVDKAAADKAAADKAAAGAAANATVPPPAPAPEIRPAYVPFRLASGAAAGQAGLVDTPGGLHFLLSFVNVPSGKYRLLILPHAGCGKPFVAPAGPPQAIPIVTAGADGGVAAAFTVRQLKLDDAAGRVLALYPADPRQAGVPWTACGAAR